MDNGWAPRVAAALAMVGGLVLAFFLLAIGWMIAAAGVGWGVLGAGLACLVATVLVLARRFRAAAGAFALAGVLVIPSAFQEGIAALLALGCWLLALVTPWWGRQ
jgi:hypothetical protein